VSRTRFVSMGALFGAAVLALLAGTRMVRSQTPSTLDTETLLSLVLPPQPDGSRPPVHLWARSDQADGPGDLPTVFVVTLYAKQTDSGAEEHETINYVQYADGTWTPVRPQEEGTLLTGDWAWISANLDNLTATASGTGDGSQYTVDYDATGDYQGSSREITVEEVYDANLALVSSTVLLDTAGLLTSSGPPLSSTATAAQSGPNTISAGPPRAAATPSTSLTAAPLLTPSALSPSSLLPSTGSLVTPVPSPSGAPSIPAASAPRTPLPPPTIIGTPLVSPTAAGSAPTTQ
jgi:hypothetical protein